MIITGSVQWWTSKFYDKTVHTVLMNLMVSSDRQLKLLVGYIWSCHFKPSVDSMSSRTTSISISIFESQCDDDLRGAPMRNWILWQSPYPIVWYKFPSHILWSISYAYIYFKLITLRDLLMSHRLRFGWFIQDYGVYYI